MASKAPKHILQAHRLISGRTKLTRKSCGKAEYKHLTALRDLYKDQNIVGIGIADKVTDGKRTGEWTLRFYVKKKKARLRMDKLIPPFISVGGKAVPTDVCEMSSPFRAIVNSKNNPVEGGFSVGVSSDPRAGTVGAIVGFGHARYILSNAHVLRGALNQTRITYPAGQDSGGNPANIVGALRHRVQLAASGNRADAALGQINPGITFNPRIPGATPPYTPGVAAKDMRVVGTGRTSGAIRGIVRVLDFDGPVRVGGATLGFEDQIVCDGHAEDGNSGTLIVDEMSGRILGLLFAASGTQFVFTPIATVIAQLGVNFRFMNPGEQ